MINTILALIVISIILAGFLVAAAVNGIAQYFREAGERLSNSTLWQDHNDSLR